MKYSVEWKGLDQGGEFTWSPKVIEAVLRAISKHGSFDYGEEKHPIWDELEKQFPDKTWRSYKKDEFRPIFRRSNTWKQLGLVNLNKRTMTLTPLATDLLVGELSLEDVIVKSCGMHKEDNDHPFAIIASAFLEKPKESLSLVDIEFGLAQNYRPGVDDLDEALKESRSIDVTKIFTTPEEIKKWDTRRRRLRSMMNQLSKVGAVDGDAKDGWRLANNDILIEIISASENSELAAALADISVSDQEAAEAAEEEKAEVKQKRSKAINKRAYEPGAGVTEFQKKMVTTTDPQRKVELLEKATRRHADTLEKLASYISNFGMEPIEDPDSFDLYGENDNHGCLFEVKSWTKSNIKDQIRKAVAQLYEYKWRAADMLKEELGLYIVLDREPTGYIDEWVPGYLLDDREIYLTWIDDEGQLISYGGVIAFE